MSEIRLTDGEREAIWAAVIDSRQDAIGTAVEAIIAARLAAVHFRVGVACDGYMLLSDADVPVDYAADCEVWAYIGGAAEAARKIRAALAPDHPASAAVAAGEFIQCPHEAVKATCAGGCNCPCVPCYPSRPDRTAGKP